MKILIRTAGVMIYAAAVKESPGAPLYLVAASIIHAEARVREIHAKRRRAT